MAKRMRARVGAAWRLIAHSLSGRLLLLTLLYVMVSETAIFLPSTGRFYINQLAARMEAAEIAILPFTEPSGKGASSALRRQLLDRAGAAAVMLKRADQRELFLADEMPARVDETVDLGRTGMIGGMGLALDCLLQGDGRTLRVVSPTHIKGAETIEAVIGEAPIRSALVAFARRLLWEAFLISLATALFVFVSLYLVVVRPMGRLMRSMIDFRSNPEDASRIVTTTSRRDEIGRAERELAAMQADLYGFLQQKARLAALGAAVAKIQHDLKNILASAQLASDRLAQVEDPVVQRLAPRLVASLNRAVTLAAQTLRYGRADEHPPNRQRVALAPLIDEAIETSLTGVEPQIAVDNRVDPELKIDADPEQLYRVVLNLVRNAAQVLAGNADGAIAISARREARRTTIDVIDNGPGIPETVQPHLFRAFAATSRPGGSGLGLAIARDLARAHGGEVSLVETSARGSHFRIVIPDRKES